MTRNIRRVPAFLDGRFSLRRGREPKPIFVCLDPGYPSCTQIVTPVCTAHGCTGGLGKLMATQGK